MQYSLVRAAESKRARRFSLLAFGSGATGLFHKTEQSPRGRDNRLAEMKVERSRHWLNQIRVVPCLIARSCETKLPRWPAKPKRAQFVPPPAIFAATSAILRRSIRVHPIRARAGCSRATATRP